MSFVVVWHPKATEDIDRALEVASEPFRVVIVKTLESVLESLKRAPNRIGESRGNQNERVAFAPPLVLYFRIEHPKGLVQVLATSVAFPSS